MAGPKIQLRADSVGEWILAGLWYLLKRGISSAYRHPFVTIPVILTLTVLITTGHMEILRNTLGWIFGILGTIITFLGPIGTVILVIALLAFIGFDVPGQIKDWLFRHAREIRNSTNIDTYIPDILTRWTVSPTARGYWLRSHWAKACKKANVTGTWQFKGNVPKLVAIKSMKHGLTGQINMSNTGQTAEFFVQHAERLSSALGRVKVIGRPVSDNVVDVKFFWHDPLEEFVRDIDMAQADKERIPYGISEDGDPITVSPFFSTLVIGRTGSGKSSLFWSYIKGLLDRKIPFVLTVIDPKSGMEFRRFKTADATFAYTETDYKNVLKDTVKKMVTRERWLASQGLEKLEHIDEQNPLHVIVIDELIEVTNKGDKEVDAAVQSLLNRGRATGFVVWGLSQASQKDAIGHVRDYFSQRIVLGVKTKDITDAALGQGATAAGAEAHKINIPGQEGVGYELNESARVPTRFRARFIDPAIRDGIVEKTAELLEVIRSTWKPGIRPGLVYRWYTEREIDKPRSERDYSDGYIGKTIRGVQRFNEHADTKDWIKYMAGVDITHHDTECETLQKEGEEIFKYKPKHNTQGKNKLMEPEC